MKKNIISYMLILIGVIMFSGCGDSTPKGSDTAVKELVSQIAKQETRRQITPLIYQKVTCIPVGLIGLKITYEDLVKNENDDKNAEVIKMINETMDKLSVSLENIRVNSIDDKLKKSESSADLIINGKKTSITYTAQLNADGELYVAVYGLK